MSQTWIEHASKIVVRAWQLIGYEGSFRIVGGKTIYEAVDYNGATARSDKVRLARVETVSQDGVNRPRQINRWVAPDTRIEVLSDLPFEVDSYIKETGEEVCVEW